MLNICLHGATGSIGMQTVDIIERHPNKFYLFAMSFGNNFEIAAQVANKLRPEIIVCSTSEVLSMLENKLAYEPTLLFGEDALITISTHPHTKFVLNAMTGSIGLKPTISAIKAKKKIAIANKEPLVMAGRLIMETARKNNVQILPVDSEHSAIFQCLQGENQHSIAKLILTASGGSFRDFSREMLLNVTKKEALNHPNWSMGEKITIDSATLVNKGLEVIEAHHLFQIPFEQIEVVLHRQSIVHSLVEFNDSSLIAHIGTSDMRIPIQYALSHPDRIDYNSRLNLIEVGKLEFENVRSVDFPLLDIAFACGKKGGAAPIVFNAANEAAVQLFLNETITFLQIEEIIKNELNKPYEIKDELDIEEIISLDLSVKQSVLSSFGVIL